MTKRKVEVDCIPSSVQIKKKKANQTKPGSDNWHDVIYAFDSLRGEEADNQSGEVTGVVSVDEVNRRGDIVPLQRQVRPTRQ